MSDLSQLNPGDPVIILTGGYATSVVNVKRATVKRVTKTQVSLNETNDKYRVSDGKKRGHSNAWERTPTLYPADHPEAVKAVREVKKRRLQDNVSVAAQKLVDESRALRPKGSGDLDGIQQCITDAQNALDMLRAYLDGRGGEDEMGDAE